MARVLHTDEWIFTAAIIFQYSKIASCDFQTLLISDIVLKSHFW